MHSLFSIHDVVKGSDDERYGFNRNCDSSLENSLCEEGEIMCTTLFSVLRMRIFFFPCF
jgi:hypothetical protein